MQIAVKSRKDKGLALINHSDRGLQYFADDYQKVLKKNGIKCSMNNNGHPYENAVAEGINKILKQEFMIDTYHQDTAIMKIIVQEAIEFIIIRDLITLVTS